MLKIKHIIKIKYIIITLKHLCGVLPELFKDMLHLTGMFPDD